MSKVARGLSGTPIQALRPDTPNHQQVATSTTAAASTAAPAGVSVARIVLESTAGFIDIGPSAVAVAAADMYLPVDVVEYFRVNEGDKFSCILDAGTGVMHVSWIR